MTRFLALVPLLAACAMPAARDVWLQPGLPVAAAERALLECRAEARARFPERPGIETTPRVTVGVGVGDGDLRGGLGTGVEILNVDRNAAPRAASVDACMIAKGYSAARLPGCSGTVTPLATQPFDTRGVCVTQDGRLAGR